VVDRHLVGTIDLDHYRGCCVDPPVVQAAEWFARTATGLDGVVDLAVAGRDRLAAGVQAVRFARPGGGEVRVLLRATRDTEPRLLTDHSTRPESPLAFDLLEVTEIG
jgi:hypothetical protein